MARKKITIDLNGGDNVTADSALRFQFYNADDSDSIITTANYAAVGSKDVPGTDGTNITYDLTTTPGSMILDGVDIGTATNLKVSVKDEANNESAKSAAFSGFLFSDTFDGLVIDSDKWTVSLPDSPNVTITQNNELIHDVNTAITESGTNVIYSKYEWDMSTDERWVRFDIKTDGLDEAFEFGISNKTSVPDPTGKNFFNLMPNVTYMRLNWNVDDGTAQNEITDILMTTLTSYESYKMHLNSTGASLYHYNGASWVLKASAAFSTPVTASTIMRLRLQNNEHLTGIVNIDNVYVTDSDFSGLIPS